MKKLNGRLYRLASGRENSGSKTVLYPWMKWKTKNLKDIGGMISTTSPLTFISVQKTDVSWRMTVDYQILN